MLKNEIALEFAQLGLPSFRAGQVFKWLHSGVTSFDEMTNLSKDLRAILDERYYITFPKILRKQESQMQHSQFL